MEHDNLSNIVSALALTALVVGSAAFVITNHSFSPAGLMNSLDGIISKTSEKSTDKENSGSADRGSGKVIAVNGNTITVQGTVSTEFTVNASGSKITKGFGSDAEEINSSEVKVGDMIQIKGSFSASATSVDSITDSGGPDDHFSASGKIESLGQNSFTVTQMIAGNKGNSYTVNINEKTRIFIDGKLGSVADLIEGNSVMVSGAIDRSTNIITAQSINSNTK